MTLKSRLAKLEKGAVDREVTLEEALIWGYRFPPTGEEEERAYADFCRRWPQSTLGKLLAKVDRPAGKG